MKSAIGKRSLCNPFQLHYTALEKNIQVGLIQWCKIASVYGLDMANDEKSYEDPYYCTEELDPSVNKFYCLRWIYSCPNGGMRNVIDGAQLKKEGVSKGYPDLGLDVARNGYHGLRIEMKTFKGKMSPEQKDWQKNHLAEGYQSVTCSNFIQARDELFKYLS